MNNYIYEVPDQTLDNDRLMLNETLFHNANGYIGIRGCYEEGYDPGYKTIRGTYINGLYDYADMPQAEKLYGLCDKKQTMLNVADTQGMVFTAGGERFSMFEGSVLESVRSLNMGGGFSKRHVIWKSPGGNRFELNIRRMASFEIPNLFLMEYKVKSLDFCGEIFFSSEHFGDTHNFCDPMDPRVAGESQEHLVPIEAVQRDNISYLYTATAASGLKICSAVTEQLFTEQNGALQKEGSISVRIEKEGHRFYRTLHTKIAASEELTVYKYSVFTDSLRCEDPFGEAERLITELIGKDPAQLYAAQKNYLTACWERSALTIEGDDELDMALKYNTYQLLQSAGRDEHSNVAAKGLSGEGYEGHYFWDTEMYMQPFFTMTNPEISKNLISYRYSTLDKARENARLLGHKKGALYPWRTIEGSECSGYFPSGTAQYHIDGDIAYSVVAYYLATNDYEFVAKKGAEIVFETARLWMDVGNYDGDRFVINCVTGPDEYTCLVNNNYYTNVTAKYNLDWAVKFYYMLVEKGDLDTIAKISLTGREVKEFAKASEKMFLPYDKERGINPQDDSFLSKKEWDFAGTPVSDYPLLLHYHPLYIYRYQVCKQADTVLAHFIYEDAQDEETIRKSFAFYEMVTTHDSSLSTCIYSIVAARLKQVEKAYKYFGDSAKLDLFDLHHNTKDGIHTANMGGNYMAVVYGFGGLRIKEDGLHLDPVIPTCWKAFRFKLCYRGRELSVEVVNRENKAEVSVSLLEGESLELFLGNEKIRIS
ncbi:MAG: family 65 glycosyl hydrolase [Lachnospiraceae bacterium]|nr:family 65 glycosyl hydrolase [Lachnospiraceae bacterium]